MGKVKSTFISLCLLFEEYHVSGTISGTGANGIQTGVAPGTKLIVAKVFDSKGDGYLSTCILGFEWAVNNNARIISFSGGSSEHEFQGIGKDRRY